MRRPPTGRDWFRSYEHDVTVVEVGDFLTLDEARRRIPVGRAWVNLAWGTRMGRVATHSGPYLREDLGASRSAVEDEARRWAGAGRLERARMKVDLLVRATLGSGPTTDG